LGDLRLFGIAIEVTEKGVAIRGDTLGQMVNEGFDLITTGISQSCGSAVVSGIGLHEAGIELMLTNQKAETITQSGVAVVSDRRGSVATEPLWCATKLFDGAETNAIGFSQCAINGASLGDSHFGAVH
jgi:hypothetical protein